MHRIYIVEDDDNIRDMVAYALAQAGFEALGFPQSTPFWGEMKDHIPALILLDIMLPKEDGISILKRLKGSGSFKKIPVIMLTAKGAEYDRIKGLDMGADDYITKPFSVMEVISRIRAVLRRCEEETVRSSRLSIGAVTLCSDKRTVLSDGAEISLTYKEFELLHYMMLNEGFVLTRDKILEQVWGFDYNGESRTVDMHIKSLRQKLGIGGNLISTIRNVGYKMGG